MVPRYRTASGVSLRVDRNAGAIDREKVGLSALKSTFESVGAVGHNQICLEGVEYPIDYVVRLDHT